MVSWLTSAPLINLPTTTTLPYSRALHHFFPLQYFPVVASLQPALGLAHLLNNSYRQAIHCTRIVHARDCPDIHAPI